MRRSPTAIGLVLAGVLSSCAAPKTPAPRQVDDGAKPDNRVPMGYFRDHRYVHPRFRFQLDFPESWAIEDTPAGELIEAEADYMDTTVTRSGTHTAPDDVEVSFFVDVDPEPGIMEMAPEPDLELLDHQRITLPPAKAPASDTTFRYEGWVPTARKRRIVVGGEDLALVVMFTYDEADSAITDQLVAGMRVH